jgi:hypothetical protein
MHKSLSFLAICLVCPAGGCVVDAELADGSEGDPGSLGVDSSELQQSAPQPGDDETTSEFAGEPEPGEPNGLEGFGCNGPSDHNPYQCNAHCVSNGFTGGYCNGFLLWYRCDCYL